MKSNIYNLRMEVGKIFGYTLFDEDSTGAYDLIKESQREYIIAVSKQITENEFYQMFNDSLDNVLISLADVSDDIALDFIRKSTEDLLDNIFENALEDIENNSEYKMATFSEIRRFVIDYMFINIFLLMGVDIFGFSMMEFEYDEKYFWCAEPD